MIKYYLENNIKSDDQNVIDRLKKILIDDFGYKYESQCNNHIFKKGNTWTNLFHFNPAKWESEIIISTDDELVKWRLNVFTFGQLVTGKEQAYWNEFHQQITKILNNGDFDHEVLFAMSRSASRINILMTLILIIIVIMFRLC